MLETRAVDDVADVLRDEITSGRFAAGSRLPPERQLAARFEVNRGTVRAALSRLAAEGLLSVRQGSGYQVRDYRRSGTLDLLPALVVGRTKEEQLEVARDLLAVRRQLATLVLERLFALEVDALAPIEDAVAAFTVAAGSGDVARVAAADLDVLAALLAATRSPVLQLCASPVANVLAELPELRDAIYAEPATNVVAYRALLAALAAPPSDRPPATSIADLLATRDASTLARLAS
ncbi:MAG: GntR family transcriptional regulator [Sandaracinus sp.]|nr:GntR family transcriptional regulator [Sandaracinus sp.]MCB9616738.1 GntR family transcriptional regulator [Sandaracinus sp.]MCB9633899.1 GntR family transcriptional regulator [Sandaracinus sp.]